MFTVVCEAISNLHPKIYRSALVGVGQGGYETPVMIVEPLPEAWPTNPIAVKSLVDEVQKQLSDHPKTSSIKSVLLKQKLPVDIRHNSKIFREQLKPWAEQHLLND